MKQYNLATYKDILMKEDLLFESNLTASKNDLVQELTYHSKDVKPGTLFVCKGRQFKKKYLKEAMDRGAIGYVSEEKYDFADSISSFIVSDVRLAMPFLADKYFNSPSKKLNLIAIGGTKGKTTTTHYVKEIMDNYLKANGKKECGLISSIKIFDGTQEYSIKTTTPEAIELQRYLVNAVESGLEYMAIEVSSQALKYNRVDCLQFEVGIFLNISHDHISPVEHENFQDYFQSKMVMFDQTRTAVINYDTENYETVRSRADEQGERVFTYSTKNPAVDFYGEVLENNLTNIVFKLIGPEGEEKMKLGMPGHFNIENALAATAAIYALDVPVSNVKEALSEVSVPGRMEISESEDGQLTTIVDYAHNKLSFERLFSSLRKKYPTHHIIAVFGAVGGKAYNRRKELGSIVGEYTDEVILTMIHPDKENPADINAPLAEHISEYHIPYQLIDDRAEAIQTAIRSVNKETLVVVTGRGNEDIQTIDGKSVKMPTDIEVVNQLMKEYNQLNKT